MSRTDERRTDDGGRRTRLSPAESMIGAGGFGDCARMRRYRQVAAGKGGRDQPGRTCAASEQGSSESEHGASSSGSPSVLGADLSVTRVSDHRPDASEIAIQSQIVEELLRAAAPSLADIRRSPGLHGRLAGIIDVVLDEPSPAVVGRHGGPSRGIDRLGAAGSLGAGQGAVRFRRADLWRFLDAGRRDQSTAGPAIDDRDPGACAAISATLRGRSTRLEPTDVFAGTSAGVAVAGCRDALGTTSEAMQCECSIVRREA